MVTLHNAAVTVYEAGRDSFAQSDFRMRVAFGFSEKVVL